MTKAGEHLDHLSAKQFFFCFFEFCPLFVLADDFLMARNAAPAMHFRAGKLQLASKVGFSLFESRLKEESKKSIEESELCELQKLNRFFYLKRSKCDLNLN